jgi:release factor glutamine methyltransferase
VVTTIKQALTAASHALTTYESGRLEAELLLAEALQTRRETLLAWPEREVPPAQLERYQNLVTRRQAGEPIAYLLGRRAFWDFEVMVNPAVLIPRPETELLVETTLALAADVAAPSLADLGTGSGAIALALARELPRSTVTAVDRSEAALAVARANAQRLGVANIAFREGSWCEPLAASQFDFVVANPPYIALDDPHLGEGDLRFEPTEALVAGEEGFGDLWAIARQSRQVLKPGGWLLVEHGYTQAPAMRALMTRLGYEQVASAQDHGGHERITFGQWIGARELDTANE